MNLIPKLTYGATTIEFTYPPARDNGEAVDAKEKTSVALDGTRWVQVDYYEATRKIVLSFLSDSQITALRTWYENHASKGLKFDWYTDNEDETPTEYELARNSFTPEKVVPVGANAFLWAVTLEFRRVI